MRAQAARNNHILLGQLREDKHAVGLLQLSREDASRGRLVGLAPVKNAPVEGVLLHPRFAVAQEKEDGSVKLRAVDHFSFSAGSQRKEDSVNGHVLPGEKLEHHTLDMLGEAMRYFVRRVGVVPGLMKADVDSAFRRIPVLPEHRWTCGVCFLVMGVIYAAVHAACPFGAVASVHAWERWACFFSCLRPLGRAYASSCLQDW